MKSLGCLFLFCLVYNSLFSQAVSVYHNSFDYSSDTIGWSHYAISGEDYWQRGVPNKPIFDSITSSTPYCWVTDTINTGIYIGHSVLETPSFNLSDTTKKFGVKFFHKRQSNSSNTKYYVEYSTNNGTSWEILYNSTSLRKGWQDTSGFSKNYYNTFQESAFSLDSLVGESNVKFRFRYNTVNHGEGWLIDDFTLFYEELDINLRANNSSIRRAQTCQVSLTINNYFEQINYFEQNKTFEIKYYLSNDSIIDASDTVLSSNTLSYLFSNNSPSISQNLTLPYLNTGKYFIISSIDDLNQVKEKNETNNINFYFVTIDSVFNVPYVNSFDNNNRGNWINKPTGNNWKKGKGTHPQISGTHSGDSAWYTVYTTPPFTYLTTPYFNLSSDTGELYISFWYKDAENTGNDYAGGVNVSTACDGFLRYPSANIFAPLIENEKYWKHINHPLNSYASEQNITFYFGTGGYNNQLIIDDIYIGHKKPDLSIEDDSFYERLIPYNSIFDTLNYTITNSGKLSVLSSDISFYLSIDSVLDISDLLLSSQNTPPLGAESDSILQFSYNVPTSGGDYFILYVIDSNNAIDEMREYNNTGWFKVIKNNVFIPPYFNDFETSITGWSHKSSLGEDNWEWSSAQGNYLNSNFSPSKGWITKDTGMITPLSMMHLYSPIFDFSNTINPSIEFTMFLDNVHMNMSYTTDGGKTWLNVKKTNGSYTKWYYGFGYEAYSGTDRVGSGGSSELFFEDFENIFRIYESYNSRNEFKQSIYNMGLSYLAGEKRVQFRFNLSSNLSEGAFIDNFSIKNGIPDLKVNYSKNLLLHPSQVNLNLEMNILNEGNYMSQATDIKFYLSSDTILDSGDYFITNSNIDSIQPKMYSYTNTKLIFPSNLATYKFLIYNLDAANMNNESNETNNIGFWSLNTDSIISFPYSNNFDDTIVNGWSSYTYSKYGVHYMNKWRWRNMTMTGELLYNTGTKSKEMFTDRINNTLSESSIPYIYLQTPSFDFSIKDSISIEFDFLAVGGGNMQYSVDGGLNWVLLNPQGTFGQNWYTTNNVYILNQPGWKHSTSSSVPAFYHCKKDISNLKGEPNVMFRFQQRGNHGGNGLSSYGMKVDNFKINAFQADYKTNDTINLINVTIGQSTVTIKYNLKNLVNSYGKMSTTNFYWSKDSLIDNNDQLVFSKNESGLAPLQEVIDSVIINIPSPIDSITYYLLYKIDANNDIIEKNETNNYGGYKVNFSEFLNYHFPNSIVYDSIFLINTQDSLSVIYSIINKGNIAGDSSSTNFYWSLDNFFDVNDILIGEVIENPINKNDTIHKNIYLPIPSLVNQSIYYLVIEIDKKDSIYETNELDNIVIIPIQMGLASVQELSIYNIDSYYSRGNIHIQLHDIFDSEVNFSVFNSVGQQIINQKLSKLSNPIIIPFNKYSTGVYYMVFKTNENLYQKKFIAD